MFSAISTSWKVPCEQHQITIYHTAEEICVPTQALYSMMQMCSEVDASVYPAATSPHPTILVCSHDGIRATTTRDYSLLLAN
jgi:hypothetical protein